MLLFIVAVAAVVVLALFYFKKAKRQGHPLLKRVPGHFLLGNVKEFKSDVVLDTFAQFPRKYGMFLEMYLLTQRLILISDGKVGREILAKRPKKFERLRVVDYSTEKLEARASLFNARGDTWLRIRKSTAPSFSNLNLSHKVAKVSTEIFAWVQHLIAQIPAGASKSSEIDMKYESFMVTVRVITIVAFGLGIDHPLVSYFIGPFQQDVIKQFKFIGESSLFPYPRWMWKYFPSKYALEKDAIDAIHRVFENGKKIINYKRELFKNGKLESNCMVDSFILNAENATERALIDDEIIVNVRTFYMAGADTTAITIAWATYYFATVPETAIKVRQEAIEILFDHKSPEEYIALAQVDVRLFEKMRYTTAFIKELLRLRAPSTRLGHNIAREEKDFFVLSNGIIIYPDDLVYINLEGIHRNGEVFNRPDEFIPERWLTEDKKQLERMEENFMPFGAGPRICPGMGLAYQEATLAVALLAYYFNFKLNCPKEEIKRIPTFVAVPTKMPIILSLAQ